LRRAGVCGSSRTDAYAVLTSVGSGEVLVGRQAFPWYVVLEVHLAFAPLLLLMPLGVFAM